MVETASTHCIRSVVMIVVLSVPISCVIDSQLDGQIPRDVLADWTTRQEQTSSIHMRVLLNRRRLHNRMVVGTPVPSQSCLELRIQGSKMDFRREFTSRDGAIAKLPSHRSVFDCSDVYQVFTRQDPGSKGALRLIHDPRTTDVSLLELRPLLLHFRPLDSSFGGLDPKEYEVVTRKATMDGHRCVEIRQTGDRLLRAFLWLDKDRGSIVLRYVSRLDGKDSICIDISHEQSKEGTWMPTHWRSTWLDTDSGNVKYSTDCVVTYSILNALIPDEEFRIDTQDLPRDTYIADVVDGTATERLEPRVRRTYWLWGTTLGAIGLILTAVFLRWRQTADD